MSEYTQTCYTLLQRACDLEDEGAWEELYEHYRRFIYYILHQMGIVNYEVEDVAQQVLVLLTKSIGRYDSSRSRFRTWLSTVIRNAALVHLRKQKSDQEHVNVFGQAYSLHCEACPTDIDRRIEAEWEEYVAELAMERISGVFKGQAMTVFEMGMEGLSAAEIAKKTGLTVASVYTLRKRVKKRLYLEIRALVAELEPPE